MSPPPSSAIQHNRAGGRQPAQVLVKNTFLQVDALQLPEEQPAVAASQHLRPRGESCDAVLFGTNLSTTTTTRQTPLLNFNDILSCIPENKGTDLLPPPSSKGGGGAAAAAIDEQQQQTPQRLLGDEEGSTSTSDQQQQHHASSSLSPLDLEESLRSFDELKKMSLDELPVPSHEKTTIMLRNIPNKYTQVMLLENLDKEFQGLYDFFYLPIDFKNKCNVGYAFINFVHPFYAEMFAKKFAGRKLTAFKSKKVCDVSWGRVQGLRANIEHYRNSPIMSMPDPKYKPLVFKDGIPLPFPGPAGQLPAVKARCRGGGGGGGAAATAAATAATTTADRS